MIDWEKAFSSFSLDFARSFRHFDHTKIALIRFFVVSFVPYLFTKVLYPIQMKIKKQYYYFPMILSFIFYLIYSSEEFYWFI